MKQSKPTVLVILDGFGYNKQTEYNAIAQANAPTLKKLFALYPHAFLKASGTAVGLMDGFIGNSEVGHMTIGCGRVIKQEVTRMHEAIDNGTFFKNVLLNEQLHKLQQSNRALHIMGLLSDAGVHSHIKHLFAFITAAKNAGITKLYIHPFLDGRDVAPQSAKAYLQQLADFLQEIKLGSIGTLQGRFYAMDRDNNWERTRASYSVLTEPQPIQFNSWQEALDNYYQQNITDEFIPPTQLNQQSIIKPNDGVILFNVRPDRARQLVSCFVDPYFNHFPIKQLSLTFFITPVICTPELNTLCVFEKPAVTNTLMEVLEHAGKRTFAIAETEKYAHVTYFFNGGRETCFPNELCVFVPSIKTHSFADYPTMSAQKITDAVIASLNTDPRDFYLINYANADMVGHSGNFAATIQAVECLDKQLEQLYEVVVQKMDGTLFITGDHGNAEQMYDKVHNQPHTAHTTNPVPFLVIKNGPAIAEPFLHELADIAPYILKNMKIEVPQEMQRS